MARKCFVVSGEPRAARRAPLRRGGPPGVIGWCRRLSPSSRANAHLPPTQWPARETASRAPRAARRAARRSDEVARLASSAGADVCLQAVVPTPTSRPLPLLVAAEAASSAAVENAERLVAPLQRPAGGQLQGQGSSLCARALVARVAVSVLFDYTPHTGLFGFF